MTTDPANNWKHILIPPITVKATAIKHCTNLNKMITDLNVMDFLDMVSLGSPGTWQLSCSPESTRQAFQYL